MVSEAAARLQKARDDSSDAMRRIEEIRTRIRQNQDAIASATTASVSANGAPSSQRGATPGQRPSSCIANTERAECPALLTAMRHSSARHERCRKDESRRWRSWCVCVCR